MKIKVLYVLGLFEDKNNPLLKSLKKDLGPNRYLIKSINLYSKYRFGSYSFIEEIDRIQKIVNKYQPDLVVGHSLGGYIAVQLKFACPLFLLDPSLSISDIISPRIYMHKSKSFYKDSERQIELNNKFLQSLKKTSTLKTSCELSQSRKVFIVGAGKGGYKIAQQYAEYLPASMHRFLPTADHNFSKTKDRKEIIKIIKGPELIRASVE